MILNYTTKIDENKTVSEIQQILGRKGAQQVLVEYKDGRPDSIMFRYDVKGQSIPFRLPCKFLGVREAMLRDFKDRHARNRRERDPQFAAQTRRVAWRIIKDWVEAQVALIEAGQAEVAEVFMPYVMVSADRTMFQHFSENTSRMLGTGEVDQ